jgi:hypothetical protein
VKADVRRLLAKARSLALPLKLSFEAIKGLVDDPGANQKLAEQSNGHFVRQSGHNSLRSMTFKRLEFQNQPPYSDGLRNRFGGDDV